MISNDMKIVDASVLKAGYEKEAPKEGQEVPTELIIIGSAMMIVFVHLVLANVCMPLRSHAAIRFIAIICTCISSATAGAAISLVVKWNSVMLQSLPFWLGL